MITIWRTNLTETNMALEESGVEQRYPFCLKARNIGENSLFSPDRLH